MPYQVTNTTEAFNYNFTCIFIAKIANVLYETTRGAIDLFHKWRLLHENEARYITIDN